VDKKINVQFALEQATMALGRGCISITLLFLLPRCYMGVGGQRNAAAALTPEKRLGTHCTGGWVGTRAGLDEYGKSPLPHWD